MKVKVIAKDWITEMYVIDNTRLSSVRYDLGAPYIDEEEPARIILCHPIDESRVREAIEYADDMELIDG